MFGLFKFKKLIFKGRSGLIFNMHKNESYYVDCEMLNGKYNIVVYKNSIRKLNKREELEDSIKNKVLKELLEELKKQGMEYEIR